MSSAVPEVQPAVIPATEEGAVGGISASNEANSSGSATDGRGRKVITLFGGFSRIEHPEYGSPDSIQKGKKITDHIANIREVIERTRLVDKS